MKTIIAPVAFGDSRLLARIWAKTQPNGDTGCWEWTGRLNEGGYGYVRFEGRMQRAHRVAYEVLVDRIPDGLVLDHLCRVRHCLNPAHLEAVTNEENLRRGQESAPRRGIPVGGAIVSAAKTHCPQGHPYSGDNLGRNNRGERFCRTCRRTQSRARRRAATVLPPHETRPSDVSAVFRAAARLIVANGHYQGDYLPDPFDREMDTPHALRPMCMAAAIKCAVSGDPHVPSLLADRAISVLAVRLEVDGEGPFWGDIFALEFHLAAWGDVEGRTVESVVAVLEAAADANEVSA